MEKIEKTENPEIEPPKNMSNTNKYAIAGLVTGAVVAGLVWMKNSGEYTQKTDDYTSIRKKRNVNEQKQQENYLEIQRQNEEVMDFNLSTYTEASRQREPKQREPKQRKPAPMEDCTMAFENNMMSKIDYTQRQCLLDKGLQIHCDEYICFTRLNPGLRKRKYGTIGMMVSSKPATPEYKSDQEDESEKNYDIDLDLEYKPRRIPINKRRSLRRDLPVCEYNTIAYIDESMKKCGITAEPIVDSSNKSSRVTVSTSFEFVNSCKACVYNTRCTTERIPDDVCRWLIPPKKYPF